VVPLLLEKARVDGIRHAREEQESKNHSRFVPRQPGSQSMERVKMVAPTGRPMIKFVDVGGKFINKHESLKRIQKLTHRVASTSRRREEAALEEKRRVEEKQRIKDAKREERRAAKKAKKKAGWQPGDGRSLVLS
jgi:hypothetical protein